MPLTMAKHCVPMNIQSIRGKDDAKRFLSSLGLTKGESVTVISDYGGNIILRVKDTRIALSVSMAHRVIV